ncbi:hypothetical protein [Aporhodopirellula aestuarii]|uniref:Peptidase MA-like domain-containing protein n=1 Tax=Aporhodopirellula aestuarii TaxID=2950107 RepID=A0ABT0U4G3_9BACT|nr:hypothetical protein [Aporhodopirellula aestuarii]MCM2371821.1 hypothetical protein [Aporhodopirellula aestuarii]
MDATANRTHSVCAQQSASRVFGPWSSPRKHFSVYGVLFSAVLLGVTLTAASSDAANFRTRNFLIEAPTPQLAKSVGDAAERYRDELATYWTGSTLPPWPTPCPVRVVAGPNLAAQGVTTYNPAPVRDFQMEVIGTPERILDSVLPHEVTHTVLATYFGRPLPRWADEGICTTVEHVSERTKHEAKLREFLSSRRGIAMNRLFLLTEYPADVLPMYAQGYSVCRFLIAQQGPRTFISFLKDYMQRPSWTANVQKHYGYESLAELQEFWLSWVEAGSGPVEQFVKADTRRPSTPDASIASLDAANASASARPQRNIAPATAFAAATRPQPTAGNDRTRSLVAANDRGRVSEADAGNGWYHRRAEGLATSSRPEAAGIEMLPPGNRVAVSNNSTAVESLAAGRTTPTWAPPSVLASGRYSAATPQPETSLSTPISPAVLDSRVGDRGRGPSSGTWR